MITSVWARTSAILLAALLAGAAAQAQNVVTDWNTIASTTIVANGGKGPAPSFVWLAYSSIAVYDAVNAVDGQFQPFYYKGSAAPGASEEAAAIAAAHRVLVNHFPAQKIALDAVGLRARCPFGKTGAVGVADVLVLADAHLHRRATFSRTVPLSAAHKSAGLCSAGLSRSSTLLPCSESSGIRHRYSVRRGCICDRRVILPASEARIRGCVVEPLPTEPQPQGAVLATCFLRPPTVRRPPELEYR